MTDMNMPELLFVYGTLKNIITQKEVIGKTCIGAHDTLQHHAISQSLFVDGMYPILEETKDKSVDGLVLDILSSDFFALDEYEGPSYKRVKVELKSGKQAWVYK